MESTSDYREIKEKKICRCFAPPMGTPFEKDGIYRWDYGIDCIIVFHGCGTSWCGSEIEFAARFQRLNGETK